jgi:hypothetical protein
MDDIQPAAIDFVTVIEDSGRWAHVPLRDDDIIIIIITTPPKCGTSRTTGDRVLDALARRGGGGGLGRAQTGRTTVASR